MNAIAERTPMKGRRLVLSRADYVGLGDAVKSDLAMAVLSEQELCRWKSRLCDARIIEADQAEPVVAMNSVVQLLDIDTGARETFLLVFPEEANIGEGKLSVLAPKGESLLGAQLGEAIVWTAVTGNRRVCIEEIHAPNG